MGLPPAPYYVPSWCQAACLTAAPHPGPYPPPPPRPGTDVGPIVPALERIWADSLGSSLADFNFRTVTSEFNKLVYQYPIRIPERYSLVIRCAAGGVGCGLGLGL